MLTREQVAVKISNIETMFNDQERLNYMSFCDLATKYIINNEHGILSATNDSMLTNPGGRNTQNVWDNVAGQCNWDLGSDIFDTICNPATQWIKWGYRDEKFYEDKSTSKWLDLSSEKQLSIFYENNFYTHAEKCFKLLPALGSAVLYKNAIYNRDGTFKKFIFQTVNYSQAAWSENFEGEINVFCRKFYLTARQAIELWGDRVSQAIKNQFDADPDNKNTGSMFKFYHRVERNYLVDKESDKNHLPYNKRPFSSWYIDATSLEVIEEGGYYDFPYYIFRWNTIPGEVYGRGPSRIAMGDILNLNTAIELLQENSEWNIRPILLTNNVDLYAALKGGDTNKLKPGDVYFTDIPKEDFHFLTYEANLQEHMLNINRLSDNIKKNFFIDKLQLPPRNETGEMSAYETMLRAQQTYKVLGGPLCSIENTMRPLLVSTYKDLLRGEAFGEIPPALDLEGIDIDITFVNQLTRSKMSAQLSSMQNWINFMGGLAQIKPEALDWVNADSIANISARSQGLPEDAVTDKNEVNQVRQQRAQQQQAMMQQQQLQTMADIGSKMEK